jgi:hypothetical protein
MTMSYEQAIRTLLNAIMSREFNLMEILQAVHVLVGYFLQQPQLIGTKVNLNDRFIELIIKLILRLIAQ